MPTVVSIVPYKFLPAQIGGQKAIALFNQYFSEHEQLVCLTVKANENNLANYDARGVLSDSRLRYMNPLNFFRIRKIIRQTKASHLLIEHPYFGWLAVLLKMSTKLKLIVRSHNIEGNRFRTIGKWWWKILWRYERWTHRNADYNFFITEEDLFYAVENFKLDRSKCLLVTYGCEQSEIPSKEKQQEAKNFVRTENQIDKNEKILFFNGSFNYKPNLDALHVITTIICPLLDKSKLSYKLIVCGPWLNNHNFNHPNVLIKGFVDDIEPYFLAADVFVNAVLDGGGIKTKLVEALSYNCNAVSSVIGANGVDPLFCNGKLLLCKNGDWVNFAEQIIAACEVTNDMSQEFYNHFHWRHITKKASAFIK